MAVVEGVEDGVLTSEDLERAVARAAAEQREDAPPSAASPEYELYAGDALDELILSLWVRGEAAERGIVVSDEEVAAEVGSAIASSFGGDEARFEAFATAAGYCSEDELAAGADASECEAIRERFRVNLLSERLDETGGSAGLREAWAPRTECAPDSPGRLCGEGGTEPRAPELPPASG